MHCITFFLLTTVNALHYFVNLGRVCLFVFNIKSSSFANVEALSH